MSAEPADHEGLERGLAELESALREGGRPTRHHARSVLVALGSVLRSRSPLGQEALRRIETAVAPIRGAWLASVREELELACGEHCLAVNPRYLGRANYDFDYTLAARARLEQRIEAAAAIGVELAPDLREAVDRADEVLRAHLPVGLDASGTGLGERSR